MEWNKVMNFGDPSTFGTEMADRFVALGEICPTPPVTNRVNPTIALTQSLRGGVVFFALFTIAVQIQNCLKYYSYAICYFSDFNRT